MNMRYGKSATAASLLAFVSLFTAVFAGCSNDGGESVRSLSEEDVRNIAYRNFTASNTPDIELLRRTWCKTKFERFQRDTNSFTDEELRELLTVPFDQRPRNPIVKMISGVESNGGWGKATVTASNDILRGSNYVTVESTDELKFAFEDGDWKLCSDADDADDTEG